MAPEICGWTPMSRDLAPAGGCCRPWDRREPVCVGPEPVRVARVCRTKFEHCPDIRHTKGVTRILGKFGSWARAQKVFFSGPGENRSRSCEHWGCDY